MIEYETETQPMNPEARRAYDRFMGMDTETWLYFLSGVEKGAVLDDHTADAFNRAFSQRGRGEDRNV